MKKSNLKTRIAAFALATISVTSGATATVPMVSAANMKQKNSIDQLQLTGKDVYKRAQKELIDIAKNTFKELPGGKYIVEFFDYCLTFVGNTFDEEKKESSLSLEDIKKQLDELKQYIVDVSVDVKLMKNKNFDDAIDEISWICDECYPKLEALVAAKCELLDAEKNGNENVLMEKQIAFNLALEDVKSISHTEIKSKLQKAMYYMTEHSISNPNPFINFYEAHKAKYDYGKDAIEETNKQYDEKVWKIFYAGLAIYDAVIQVNIDELCADPATEAYGEKMAKDYARFLNGDGAANDTTSVVYVTKYYQKAVNEKAKHINEYSYDTDKSAFFNDLAMGRIDVSGFFSVGDKKNMDIIRFIDKNGSGADSARYKEYFNAVKHLIEEQYMSRDNHKMTLRHFLEENFNINYRINIWKSEKSYIGGNINSSMFNIDNTKFSLRNLTIKNFFTNSKLISGQSSRIFLDNCVLDNNEMNCLIEAELLGIKNTVFNNNEFTINTKNLSITNLTSSDNHVLFNSTSYGNNWEITDSTFTHNQGPIFLYSANTLTIKNSILNDNTGKNQDSCIIIDDSAKLNIISTIITNNKVPIINKIDSNSIVDIENSIILNNSAGFISNNFDNVDCNYNWWGNTIENAKISTIVTTQVDIVWQGLYEILLSFAI